MCSPLADAELLEMMDTAKYVDPEGLAEADGKLSHEVITIKNAADVPFFETLAAQNSPNNSIVLPMYRDLRHESTGQEK